MDVRGIEQKLKLVQQSEIAWKTRLSEHMLLREKLETELLHLRQKVKESKKSSFFVVSQLNEAKNTLRNLESEYARVLSHSRFLLADASKLEEDEWVGRSRVRGSQKSLHEVSGKLAELNEARQNSFAMIQKQGKRTSILKESLQRKIKESLKISGAHDEAVVEREGLVLAISIKDEELKNLAKRESDLQKTMNLLNREIESANKELLLKQVVVDHMRETRRNHAPRRQDVAETRSGIEKLQKQLEREEGILSLLSNPVESMELKRTIRFLKGSWLASKSAEEMKSMLSSLRKQVLRAENRSLDLHFELEEIQAAPACKEISKSKVQSIYPGKKLNALRAEIRMYETLLMRNKQAVIDAKIELDQVASQLAKANHYKV